MKRLLIIPVLAVTLAATFNTSLDQRKIALAKSLEQKKIQVDIDRAAHKAPVAIAVQKTAQSIVKIVAPPPEPPKAPQTPNGWMDAVGISWEDRQYVDYIVSQESGWCPFKWEGQHGICPDIPSQVDIADLDRSNLGWGLCQSTPPRKMATAGLDWKTSPVTQLKWCAEYIRGYGSWAAAANFKRCTGACYSPRTRRTEYKRTPWF